jgi:glutamate synthase (NADPH/NADH) small chain
MEKWVIERRLDQMEAEGVTFRPGVNVGGDIDARSLLNQYDAVCLAGGATWARDLEVPGRELKGTYFAMEFLPQQNRRNAGDEVPDAVHQRRASESSSSAAHRG